MKFWTRKLEDGERLWMPEGCRVRVYRETGPYDLIPGEEITAHKSKATAHIGKDSRLPFLHILHHEGGFKTTFIASQLIGVGDAHCREITQSLTDEEVPRTTFISAADISTPRSIMPRAPTAAKTSLEDLKGDASKFISAYLGRPLAPFLRDLVRKFFPPQSDLVWKAEKKLSDPLAVSMGCKVDWSECSLCGAKGCEHLSPGALGGFPKGEVTSLVAWGAIHDEIEFVLTPAQAKQYAASFVAKRKLPSPHIAIDLAGGVLQFWGDPQKQLPEGDPDDEAPLPEHLLDGDT